MPPKKLKNGLKPSEQLANNSQPVIGNSATTSQQGGKKGQFTCPICDDVIIDAGGKNVVRIQLNVVAHVHLGCINIVQAFQRLPLIRFVCQTNLSFALNAV